MIEINIRKQIGKEPVGYLLSVDTQFKMHTITRISGPSGSGKTTLLKMIAGLINPEEGKIVVSQDVWFDKENNFTLKVQLRQIGFVFQDYGLFPNMSVLQHMLYGTSDLNYIEALLDIAEITLFKNRYPRELSGGQQQRLSVIRALSTKPKLLLMDEPFSALDQALKKRFTEKLKHIFHVQQTTVLLVSHQDDGFDAANYTLLD